MVKRLAMIGLVLLLSGCRSQPPDSSPSQWPRAKEYVFRERDYMLDAPDEIIIHCIGPGAEYWNNQRRQIAHDGTINLPLIGDCRVADLTTHECLTRLRELASAYFRDPQITITVIDNSKFYYVDGPGLNEPKAVIWTGHETLYEAIAVAGVADYGRPRRVILSRPRKNGPAAEAVVDVTQMTANGDLTQNYLLERGDTIRISLEPCPGWNVKPVVVATRPTVEPAQTFGPDRVVVRPGKS